MKPDGLAEGADSTAGAGIRRIAPLRVDLPPVAAGRRMHRLGRTVVVGGRHVLPVIARRLLRRPHAGRPMATAIRRTFEDLGATYVKFGQFIASAPAIFGDDVADVFRGCLDGGPAVPASDVRAAIEADLGRPLDSIYAWFDPIPLAAASLAVVHRARLTVGTDVVVKVLRPGIEHQVAADLALMQPVMRALARQGSEPAGNAFSYLVGLKDQICEELDLRNEARAMATFRRLFERFGLSLLVIPQVHQEATGQRVLTMEYLDGVPVDSLAHVELAARDRRPVVRQLADAWVVTGACEGTFHADIHAGNLLLLRDGRLGMIDWGIVARLDPQTHLLFRRLLQAAIGMDEAWDDIAAHVIALQGRILRDGLGLTDAEIAALVRALVEPVLTRPVGEVSMATLFGSLDEMVTVATGRPPQRRTLGDKLSFYRKTRRALRIELEQGFAHTDFRRANFLAAKQLVYLERYWRMYLPDEPLLGDHEFIRRALAAVPDRSGEGSAHAGDAGGV